MSADHVGSLLDPATTCLLLVDACNDFLDPNGKTALRSKRPLAAARATIPRLQALLSTARAAGVPPIFVQHTTLAAGASDSPAWLEARSRATFSVTDLCEDGSWGQEIVPELAPNSDERVVKKFRYSGFTGTNLDLLLRSFGCRSVVCCGVSTNVCVESTARAAFELDYFVVIPADACASWDMSLHEATLATAARRYATVTTVEEVAAAWQRAR